MTRSAKADGDSAPHATLVQAAHAPYAEWLTPHAYLPGVERLNACAREAALALPDGRALSFVAAPRLRPSALEFERRIHDRGEIYVREGSEHDVWNALAWLRFGATKSAVNALHVAQGDSASGNKRGPCRDAATLLDESGVIVACDDVELVDLWRRYRWRAAFWDLRDDVAAKMRVVAIGHGLLVKLAAPYPSITAAALVLPIAAQALPSKPSELATRLDGHAARWLIARGAELTTRDLLPLPLSALPGWCAEELSADAFDDGSVFRERDRLTPRSRGSRGTADELGARSHQ